MVDGTGHARVFEIMSLAAMALFDEESITTSIARLRDRGLSFAPGLSDAEVSSIEAELEFVFPPELRFFLQMALPTSPYFVNWRAAPAKLRYWFDKQTEGVLFDVQNHVFWHDDWGPRPMDVLEAVALAKEELTSVPKLIPIGDRIFTKCVPATPCIAGNPIFSVNQTDVLHAGQNLGDYLQWFSRPTANFERDEENGESPTPLYSESYRSIEFWTDLVRWNMA